jgi:hypothetical protein
MIMASRTKKSSANAGNASERIDKFIAALDDWRGDVIGDVRAMIRELDPNVQEDWKWMGTPVWSHEGMFVHANPFKGKVKLTFMHGAKLKDPKGLFNAGFGGNTWRAIDIFEGDKIDKTALKALLREAMKYNEQNDVAKSRGSRH